MRWLLNVLAGRRRRMEREFGRELADHLDRRMADLEREGLDAREARRRALLELGGRAQVQEAVRDTWMPRWLADRARDVRFAVRALVRQPAFTATAVLSLALGIGASAAIFSLVDQVLLRPLPVREPDRLVLLGWEGTTLAPGFGSGSLLTERMCRGLQETDAFDGAFCRHPRGVNLTVGTRSEPVAAEFVSGSYFQVLGIQPALGRLIGPADDVQPGAHPVVVLSHGAWRTRFNGAADILGRRVLVNSHPMTVIGVAPATFRGVDLGEVPSLWVPISMKLQTLPSWVGWLEGPRTRWLHAFGRLKPGVSADQASALLQPWFAQVLRTDMTLEDFPVVSDAQRDRYLASTLSVSPGGRGRSNLRESLDMPLRLLLAGTVLLHLLASLNVASLLLARGAGRTREIQTRMALGASRSRVVALLLAESAVLTLGGALVGTLVAPLVSHTLVGFLQRDASTMAISSHLNAHVFAFACAASIVTTVLCTLALLWQSGRQPLVASLRVRGGQGGSVRLRKVLIVGQVAFTLVLLMAAGLFMQTLARLEGRGPGFRTTDVMTFAIDPRQSGHDGAASRRLVSEVLSSLRAQPGVLDAAVAGVDLLDGGSWNDDMTIAAGTRLTTDRDVHLNPVTPNFFDMMGVPIVAGRGFDERDAYRPGESGPFRSIIVNETFVRRYFGDQDPVGRRVGLGSVPDVRTDIEIIGVVQDFAYRNMREEAEHGFFSFLEDSGEGGTFYVRMETPPDAALGLVRTAVDRVDAGLPLLWARTLDEQVALSLMTERMLATLSGGFGVVALLLSAIGLYGVLAFVVTSRTRERGIRLALGATRVSAVRSVVGEALVMLAVGAGVALPCIWGLGRFVEAQLFGVEALDLPTIGGACLVLLGAGLVGAMLPAWRAAAVRPTEALGAE